MPAVSLTRKLRARGSAPKIADGDIQNFVAPAAENGIDHIKRETLGHFDGDGGRHRELLPVHYGIDQHRPVVSERSRNTRLHVRRVLKPDTADAHSLRHGGEIRVLE